LKFHCQNGWNNGIMIERCRYCVMTRWAPRWLEPMT
jgi:hypothetical protein